MTLSLQKSGRTSRLSPLCPFAPSPTRCRARIFRMRWQRPYGSVQGAGSNGCPYRDPILRRFLSTPILAIRSRSVASSLKIRHYLRSARRKGSLRTRPGNRQRKEREVYSKRIVCLANSTKTGGRCIAGKEFKGRGKYGAWIRPIGGRETDELSISECALEAGAQPKLLDVIEVPFQGATPHNHQSENHLIYLKPWRKVDKIAWSELKNMTDQPARLWNNHDHTRSGQFDCMNREDAFSFSTSLALIWVPRLAAEVSPDPRKTTKDYRGSFVYMGDTYKLKITDPAAIESLKGKGDGIHEVKDAFLTISLTEPWKKDNNRCYKLIAAIITNPPL